MRPNLGGKQVLGFFRHAKQPKPPHFGEKIGDVIHIMAVMILLQFLMPVFVHQQVDVLLDAGQTAQRECLSLWICAKIQR